MSPSPPPHHHPHPFHPNPNSRVSPPNFLHSDRFQLRHFHPPHHPSFRPLHSFHLHYYRNPHEDHHHHHHEIYHPYDTDDDHHHHVLDENVKRSRNSGRSTQMSHSPIRFQGGVRDVDDDYFNHPEQSRHATPSNILQKKSAFLRIHPAKHQHNGFRNRFFNASSTSSPSPSPHIGKHSNSEILDPRISEDRVGIPVELNVPFKSNALVAKAITAAPSCSDGESPSRVVKSKINTPISKREGKDSKNTVGFSSMKRLGNLNNTQVHGNRSESSPSVSGSSNSHKASPKSEVLKKGDKNAKFEKVSSPPVRKKRKAISPLSRLSSVAPSKADTELENWDNLPNCLSDGSTPSDTPRKQLEKESSCARNNMGSALTEYVDMAKIDLNDTCTVADQVVVVGLSERSRDILDTSPHCRGSLGSEDSEHHGNAEVCLQGEQRVLIPDVEIAKFVEKCSSDILTKKHGVEGEDTGFLLVNNGSVERSSTSMDAGELVENNDISCENAEALNPIAVMNSTTNPVDVLNNRGNEVDLNCPVVDSNKACLSSSEVVNVGLSLDIDNEPSLRHAETFEKKVGSALNINCPSDNAIPGSPCVESDVSHGNGFTESRVKCTYSVDSTRDLDPVECLSSCGKKRKTLSMESIISDALGSQSSEFIPLAEGPSVNCSPQLVEGYSLSKPAIVEEEVGGATSSLCTVLCNSTNNSESDNVCKDLCVSIIESAPPDGKQSVLSEHGRNQKIDVSLMIAGANDQTEFIVLESECTMAAKEDQVPLPTDMECDDTTTQDANLLSVSGCATSIYHGVTTNSDLVKPPSNVGLPDQSHLLSTTDVSNACSATQMYSVEKPSVDEKKLNQPLTTQSSSTSHVNLHPEFQKNLKLGMSSTSGIQSRTQKSVPLLPKHVKTAPSSRSINKTRRNVLSRSEPSISTSHHTTVINTSAKTQTYPSKTRTWHRASNSVGSEPTTKKAFKGTAPPHMPLYGKALKVQNTSYIRKGNSLVRNPTSGSATSDTRALGASTDRLKPKVTDQDREGCSLTIVPSELPEGLVIGGRSAPIEMPKTPPLPCSGKTSHDDIAYSVQCTPSVPVSQSEETDNQLVLKSSDTLNSVRDPESLNRNLEDPGMFSDGDVMGSNSKRLIYIKRKSNQLIAASKASHLSVRSMDKKVASSSDINYYKRKKNQLIRASSEGNIHQMLAVVDDGSKLLSQNALRLYPGRSSTKRLSNKGKSSKRSLVWKLGDSKSFGKGMDAWKSGRLLSHILPWKRTTHWSRKLLSSRKRGVVYVRSGRGFSLRRSKVLSFPGMSLKWSKSMEKRSKKVEEEAAMAAAMDSVQNSGSSGVSSKVHSNLQFLKKPVNGWKLHSGERIFRIGVFRYRMDPSRRTLQRISDEVVDSTALKTQKDARNTYVPKRLLIGSDEYIRIGNGNQLVRDPKRRTRILASEKVRWSVHTARKRLAKKRKFCQFFTRFGKCNKGEGKCPFIHDPSKIAVCTKFLKGLCADQSCNLTHKVIPERMPDCSFFLQGLCSNEKCPYRHVNVNPKASICESFLRGYCAEGNECRKKHSYICPEFEASGSCRQGSQCKLYHPKEGKPKKKRKVERDDKNSKGRYFGSSLSKVVDPETRPVLEKHGDSFASEEDLGDFISLNVSDDDDVQENEVASEQTSDDMMTLQLDDVDLIKPLRILGRV